FGSTSLKALYTTSVVMITEITAPIIIIDIYPGPSATIIIGPSATLGIAFRMTKYGSDILATRLDDQSTLAKMIPKIVPNKNPIIVSNKVTDKWSSIEPSGIFGYIYTVTLEGELNNNGSMMRVELNICQLLTKMTNIIICHDITREFSFFIRRLYLSNKI